MDRKYWLGRKRASLHMAKAAASAESRLIHYELAGRCSVNAAAALAGRSAVAAPALELPLPLPPTASGSDHD